MSIDVNGRTWQTVEAHLRMRLAQLREKNDSDKLDAQATAALRGEIAAVKDLLALPEQVARVEQDDPGYGNEFNDA